MTVSERNDTEDPDFDGYDYLIWFKIATIGPDHTGQWYGRWQVRRAPERAVQTPSFDAGVPLRDRMISFVKSIQTDAIKLGAPEGAGVAANHRDSGPGGSLSGIVIDAGGHIVTNNHGVQGCHDMRVRTGGDTLPAKVLAQDSLNDLALLKVDHSFGATAKFRDDTPIRQGEPVTAVGFPLGDALASHASVTTGTVSALAGIHNDTRFLQFTAPVQQGNSGGPLLDGSGNVAGIVTSKLSALLVAVATGDIPQNVNFALKKTVVESFLDANSIRYAIAAPGKESSAADIGEAAKRYTLFVECRK